MHRIGFVVFPGFDIMAFSAVTVFETANRVLETPTYEVTILSETGGPVQSSAGFRIETQALDDTQYDTVLFGSGVDTRFDSAAMADFVRRATATSRRIAAPCTGAYILAAAGVLDGRRATTHWRYADDLQQRHPAITVEKDQIFVVDGPVWTSAGMAATIDFALAMVERDVGAEISRTVARRLVVYHRRAGGQSQFSALLEIAPRSDRIQKAFDHARAHLRDVLSVDKLAEIAGLSPRQFSRAFKAETGLSPARAVEQLRVEAARLRVEQGRLSMDVIAEETGFGDREHMRRAFLRTLGQPPQTVRHIGRAGRAGHTTR